MQQELNINCRKEKKVIDEKLYIIYAEESPHATETAFSVLQRIIRRNMQQHVADNRRICCLNSDINGGKKVC